MKSVLNSSLLLKPKSSRETKDFRAADGRLVGTAPRREAESAGLNSLFVWVLWSCAQPT